MFDRLEFFFTEAFTALRRNAGMTFAAVSTAAMALFLIGGLGIGFVRLNAWLDTLKQDYQIRIFLKPGLTSEDRKAASDSVQKIVGVQTVLFISKDQGLKEFARKNPNIDVSDLTIDNPLPDVFQVTISDLDEAPRISEKISAMDFVEPDGVKASDDLRSSVEQIIRYSRFLGVAIAGIMFITGGVLIYNAIRLTIVARRREIRIMELVGATRTAIQIPLLIEGSIHGILGGLLAFVLLILTVDVAGRLLRSLDTFIVVNTLPPGPTLSLLIAAGALYGLVCSALAARNPRSDAS
jgi:cell division transport system permease protein